jgi:hypothetical protein
MDRIAEGLTWDSLRTRAEMVFLANWMGRPLRSDIAASADMVLELSAPLVGLTTLVDSLARFGTVATKETPQLSYENIGDPVEGGPTGFSLMKIFTAAVWADYVLLGPIWPLMGAGVGDVFAIGHENLMFDSVIMYFTAMDAWGTIQMEYYDEAYTGEPDVITDLGGTIRATLNTYLGRTDSCAGLTLRITLKSTGEYEDIVVTYAGGTNRIDTVGALGQLAISLIEGDYEITGTWMPIPGLHSVGVYTGATTLDPEMLDQTGYWRIYWDALQSETRHWGKATIAGEEAYWIRWRVTVFGAPGFAAVATIIQDAANGYKTTWSAIAAVRQGETVRDVLGTTDGTAFQQLRLNREPLIDGSISSMTIGTDDGWTLIDSLYDATSTQKVFVLEEGHTGARYVRFGDGTHGAIPTSGQEIVLIYRIGADEDGNVGENTITQLIQGAGLFSRGYNPRPASGWMASEASTPALLEEARRLLPGDMRALKRAVALEDYEVLAREYQGETGQPVARAFAVENLLGAKTIGLYVVGPGGTFVSLVDRELIEEYFNGITIGLQKVGGVGMINTETTCINYTPVSITVTVTVEVLAGHAVGVEGAVLQALQVALAPTSVTTEGNWKFHSGTEVSLAYIGNIIAQAAGAWFVNHTIAAPGADVPLAAGELPIFDLAGSAVTVVEV